MQGTLIICPVHGDLARNTDFFTRMDPYVKVFLGTQHKQTRVAREQGKHPDWRDELTFQYYNQHDDNDLKFEVWDEDTHRPDDLVGSGTLAVATVVLSGNKMQTWVQLSYKGKSAGQILVDATFIPKNEINQQTQPNYQAFYPVMMPNQGMVYQQIPQYQHQQTQQLGFVQQNSYPNQGFFPQQVQGQPGFPQQMFMQPQYQSQHSFQLQQPGLIQQHSCPNCIPQQVQGQLGSSQQLQMQPRYQSQPSLVSLNSFPNKGSPPQQVQVQVQPQYQQQKSVQLQSISVKQDSFSDQSSLTQADSIQFDSFIPRGF